MSKIIATNLENITNDQKLSTYINLLYDEHEWNIQFALNTKPLVQPFVDSEKNAELWPKKYYRMNMKSKLKFYDNQENSIVYIKILELENKYIIEQNDYFISHYEKKSESAKNGSVNVKNKFEITKLASESFKEKFKKNKDIKIPINDKIFETCFIKKKNIGELQFLIKILE
ncbi:hypothetical protein GVAV_002004 [Gurleya vavrai]